jgi:cytochrome c biogenesis factor
MDTNILIAFIPLLKNILHKSKQGNIRNNNVFHIYILICLVLALFAVMLLGTFSNLKNHEIQFGVAAVLISIYYSLKLYTHIEQSIVRNNTPREIINFIQV